MTEIILHEVGMRDGLQIEKQIVPTEQKIRWIEALIGSGVDIPMAKRALAAGKTVQVSIQSAFGCGLEGEISADRVLDIVRRYLDAGLTTINLSDTAGHAVPDRVEELYGAVLALDPAVECACHFHDTYGLGMANTIAALKAGVKYFELAFAGLGGCPFTAATGGNLSSEDFLYFLQRTGRRCDIDLAPIIGVASEASRFFGRSLPGAVHRIGPIKPPTPRS